MNKPKFQIGDVVVNVNNSETKVVTAIAVDELRHPIYCYQDIRSYHWSSMENYVKQSEYTQYVKDRNIQKIRDLQKKKDDINTEIENLKGKLMIEISKTFKIGDRVKYKCFPDLIFEIKHFYWGSLDGLVGIKSGDVFYDAELSDLELVEEMEKLESKFKIGDTVIRTDNDYGKRSKVAAIARDIPLSTYRYVLDVPPEIVRADWIKEEVLITESEYKERKKRKTIKDILQIDLTQDSKNEFIADSKLLTGCPPIGRGKSEYEALYDLLAKLMFQIGTQSGEGYVNQWTSKIKQYWMEYNEDYPGNPHVK